MCSIVHSYYISHNIVLGLPLDLMTFLSKGWKLVYAQPKFCFWEFTYSVLLLLTITCNKKVIWIWTKMRKLVNACMWLAELASASKHYFIWTTQHQLIASWWSYKEIHKGKQSNMYLLLVCTCSYYQMCEFQSTFNLVLARYCTSPLLKN